MKNIKWFGLIVCVVFVELIGFLSGILAGDIGGMYEALVKPPFAPPGAVFGIVWPVLYALMGIAIYLIWETKPSEARSQAVSLFWVQIAFNFAWSILFFRFGLLWAALVELIILDVLVIKTVSAFGKLRKSAAWMMIPYLIWILFATYLNLGFAWLN